MNKKSVVIGPAINGFIVSNNKNPQPVDSNDLMVFDDIDKLLNYIARMYGDNENINVEIHINEESKDKNV